MEIQITAIKFETVNGKKTGKSFSFKADPKKLAVFKTEATLRKKIKEYVAKSGIFKKEELDDVKYNMKDFLEEWKKQVVIVQAEELAKLEASPNNPDSRITPDMITRLAPNEVFVFGSNEQGLHSKRSVCLRFQRARTPLWWSCQSCCRELWCHYGPRQWLTGEKLCNPLHERNRSDGRICQRIL